MKPPEEEGGGKKGKKSKKKGEMIRKCEKLYRKIPVFRNPITQSRENDYKKLQERILIRFFLNLKENLKGIIQKNFTYER